MFIFHLKSFQAIHSLHKYAILDWNDVSRVVHTENFHQQNVVSCECLLQKTVNEEEKFSMHASPL